MDRVCCKLRGCDEADARPAAKTGQSIRAELAVLRSYGLHAHGRIGPRLPTPGGGCGLIVDGVKTHKQRCLRGGGAGGGGGARRGAAGGDGGRGTREEGRETEP